MSDLADAIGACANCGALLALGMDHRCGRKAKATAGTDERCPRCDLAECKSLLPRSHPSSTLLCDGEPVDWRARCLEAEAERDEALAKAATDERQCDEMTATASRLAEELAAAKSRAASADLARVAAVLATERMRRALEEAAKSFEAHTGIALSRACNARSERGYKAARAALAPGDGDVRVALEDLLNASINVAHLPTEAHVEWGNRAIDDFLRSLPGPSAAALAEAEALLACRRAVEVREAAQSTQWPHVRTFRNTDDGDAHAAAMAALKAMEKTK